jgi:hypothetical protein
MDTIIVYIDDAAYALHLLQPMLFAANPEHAAASLQQPSGLSTTTTGTQWILVGCAPRVTRRVSKWVTHSARDSWRRKWADKVFSTIVPALQWRDGSVTTMLADANLSEQTESLMRQHRSATVLDARRPKLGQDLQPVTASQVPERQGAIGFAAAMAGATLLAGID